MAATSVTAEQLKLLIIHTLSPDTNVRKPAEAQLMEAQKIANHHLEILKIVASDSMAEPAIRQAAAVRFKNVIAKGWDTNREDGNDGIVISPADRETIKTHLVELMCNTPSQVQSQLSAAVGLIATTDYPQNWPNLLGQLVQQFQTSDSVVLHGVLKTADSIFVRFVGCQRSDDLYRVLKYTLEGCQSQLMALLQHLGQAVVSSANNAPQLKANLESMTLVCKIAYSLNYLDLPEFFEDNMGAFVGELKKYLVYQNAIVTDPEDDDEPGPIDNLQSAIIEIFNLYANKDEEPFMPYLPELTSTIWNLLIQSTTFPKHDSLVTTSIKFLSMLVEKEMHSHLFKSEGTLREIVLKIVIPNLMCRESDQERFEDDPREFLIREVEGCDNESRRRWSGELLKAMCRQFATETTAICSEHVGQMLSEYARDPNNQWAMKDAAINLMMGIAIVREGFGTGVSEVRAGVNVIDFFQGHVLPELQDVNHGSRPVVKAAALKFVAVFRNQFSKEQLVQLVPIVIKHLASPIVVVHTFAAYVIHQMLITKETPTTVSGNGPKKLVSTDLRDNFEPLFTGLFKIIDNVALNENDYAMKCVMRSLATAGQDVVPITQTVIEKLTGVLERVSKNPRNPQFNHFLFESIAVLVKNACLQNPTAAQQFQPLLFPPFTAILQNQVIEFTPYVFQVLAQLLEFRPAGSGLGDAYTGLLPPLLKTTVWENRGNVPALARLIAAYIAHAPTDLVAQGEGILGICQKLLASKATEVFAFEILSAVLVHFPKETMNKFVPTLMQVLLNRLQAAKTPRYCKHVSVFFALFVGMYNAQAFIDCLNGMQVGLPLMVIGQIWCPSLESDPPSTVVQAKTHVVGLTRLMCQAPSLLGDVTGTEVWKACLKQVVGILSSPAMGSGSVNEIDTDGVTISYDSVFSRLVFSTKQPFDPFATDVPEPKAFFVNSLHDLLTNQREQIQPLIHQSIGDHAKLSAGLQQLFRESNRTLG